MQLKEVFEFFRNEEWRTDAKFLSTLSEMMEEFFTKLCRSLHLIWLMRKCDYAKSFSVIVRMHFVKWVPSKLACDKTTQKESRHAIVFVLDLLCITDQNILFAL